MDDRMGNSMLHQNIREARKHKGLSQAELANLLNVSRQTVSNWETGLSVPDVMSLSCLQQYLELPVEQLLGREPISESPDDTAPMTDQEIAKELAKFTAFYAAEIERRKRVEKIVLIALTILVAALFLSRFVFPIRVEIVTELTERSQATGSIMVDGTKTSKEESVMRTGEQKYMAEQLRELPAEALLNLFIEHGLKLDDPSIAAMKQDNPEELARVFKAEFDLFIQGTTALSHSAWNDMAKQVQKIYQELTK